MAAVFNPDLTDIGANVVTGAAAAETLNADQGVVTTEALATALDAVSSRTLTNSKIKTTSQVFVDAVLGGTNTSLFVIRCTAVANGSCTIKLSPVGAALNGTVKYAFIVR